MKFVCLLVAIKQADGSVTPLALSPSDDAWFVEADDLTPDAKTYFKSVVEHVPGAALLGGVYRGED